MSSTPNVVANALRGETVVVTGRHPGMTRSDVNFLIQVAGGVAANALSSGTTLLVACQSSGQPPSAKLTTARKRLIPVIDETQLERILAGLENVHAVKRSAFGGTPPAPPVARSPDPERARERIAHEIDALAELEHGRFSIGF